MAVKGPYLGLWLEGHGFISDPISEKQMASDREKNRLTGRMRRYARVGGSMGTMAVRYGSGRLLGRETDKQALASDLRVALGGLKGPVMKVAQILSTIPDALPREFAAELSQLQAAAPSMGRAFVKRRMQAELGPGWQQHFTDFDFEAAAAASLGQVHKATGLNGTTLALKLQYPDMTSTVEADIRQLELLLALYHRRASGIDTAQIKLELAERLREELDYRREARNMQLYSHMLADEPHVHVPVHVPELSTGRLLAMTWLEGRPLLSFVDQPQEVRDLIATNLFHAWYIPFHRYGVIHGDPHLGNYTATRDHDINLMDFGCIRVFPPVFVEGVITLYRALRHGDQDMAVHAYELWGFDNLTPEIIEVLNIWASFLYAPLLDDATRLINAAEKPGLYGADVAAKVHRELKRLGPVTPPRPFVLMDRAAVGLGGVFLHLQAKVNWFQLFQDLIEGFSVDDLAQRQNEALDLVGL